MTTEPPPPRPSTSSRLARRVLRRTRDRIALAFGVTPPGREAVLVAMLERHSKDVAGYWLQLLLAMGIATLGLALGSTAVVIGAMLISPLMGPIVNLGMALAVGSSYLATRAFIRTAGSILVVVASAAAITLALPFHEVTSEIAARTTPTVLDLLIAVLCALAAAFAAARPSSDTTSAAAGTAIGIALVPPLCVVGFGLGTRQLSVARGASLLFTANLCAIVLFAVLTFLVLGFDLLPVEDLENRTLTGERADRLLERMARRLRRAFGNRYSRILRLMMPALLVLGVYFPLRRALEEVAWQVRVRGAIARIIRHAPGARDAVRSAVTVERHAVDVRLVVVASPVRADELESYLRARVARAAGVEPSVRVTAVPDFASLQAAVAVLDRPDEVVPAPARAPDLDAVRRRLSRAIDDAWPADAAGPIVQWRLAFAEDGLPVVEIAHLGPALGAASESLLARALTNESGMPVWVRDVPLSTTWSRAPLDAGARWIPALVRAVEAARRFDALFVCVTQPAGDPALIAPGVASVRVAVAEELAVLPAGRAGVAVADEWGVVLSARACAAEPPSAPADGGAP